MKPSIWKYLLVLLFPAFIAGCGINPQVLPQTPAQTAFYTYGLYTTVENTLTDQLTAKVITVETAKKYQAQLQQFRQTIDGAQTLAKAGLAIPQTQLEALQQAQKILQGILTNLQQGATQ